MKTHKVNETQGGVFQVTTFGQGETIAPDVPLVIDEGTTWTLAVELNDQKTGIVDLSSGYTAQFQIRAYPGATDALVSKTQAAGVTLSASSPNILTTLTAAETLALSFVRAVYELRITTTGTGAVLPVMRGTVQLRKAVVE